MATLVRIYSIIDFRSRTFPMRPNKVEYLLNALKRVQKQPPVVPKAAPLSKPDNLVRFSADNIKKMPIITLARLNAKFAAADNNFLATSKEMTSSQHWWNRANTELEWTLAGFKEIPDIKVAALERERQQKLGDVKRTSFGYDPQMLKPLPEILVMGHTNVGKSLILNTLFGKGLAYVAKTPGYTKTINCYNVGKQFRLLDSPGYGERGDVKQGEFVLEYLANRKQLRKVYILVDSEEGFLEDDLMMIEHVINLGVPCDVVFTKVDKIIQKYYQLAARDTKRNKFTKAELESMVKDANDKVIDYYRRCLQPLGDIRYQPQVFFNNSYTNNYVHATGGFKHLRANIFQACGHFK